VRGTLQLIGPSGAVELRARAVRYHLDGGDRISFHANLARYEGLHGTLKLDDEPAVDVRVMEGWLAVMTNPDPDR
jgi:hypothetical protein